MVKEHDHVPIPASVEMLELIGHPRELDRIICDVRVQRDEKAVSIAKRVCRVAVQPPRRSFWWNQLRNRGQRVAQSLRASIFAAGVDIVIASRQVIRNIGGLREPFDEAIQTIAPIDKAVT